MASQAEVDLVINATRTLPELERDLDRVLRAAQSDMSDLDVDAVLNQTATLRQLDRDLGRVIAAARAGADDIDLDAALNQQSAIRQTTRDLDNLVRAVSAPGVVPPALVTAALNSPVSINRVRGELDDVIRVVQATAPDIDVDVDIDQDGVRRLTSALTSAAGAASRFGTSIATSGAVAGTAAPLVAGLATAVQNVAPAAAVGTSAILAMKLATGALKIGMMGVSEAISEAFKPDADMEKVNEALARLSPSARAAATEIIGMKGAFKDLQLDVQEKLFKGFATEIKGLGKTVLPDLKRGLVDSAGALNQMGKGVSQAGQALSDSGVLGQALKSSTNGLEDLVRIPGQATLAFGQLAAAAGPSFERITTAVAGVADKVSKSLSGAFKSGALEDSIDEAVDAIAQLGRVAGNVFAGIGNIINAVSIDGQGLFGTLEDLSQGFEDLTGTDEFQAGLKALSETMALLYKTAGPLLAEAFKILGGVLVELSGPAQELIKLLGEQFGGILEELGPVLITLADSFGKLVGAVSPLIELAGELITALLPSLTPLFKTLGVVFQEMTPFIAEVARILGSILLPVLEKLPGFLEIVLAPFNQFVKEIFPVLVEQLERMAPDFEELGRTLADLLVELAPLIAEFLTFILLIDAKIIPIIGGILLGTLALLAKALTFIADTLNTFVIPSIQFWIDLLQGDFQDGNVAAWENVFKLRDNVIQAFNSIVGGVTGALSRFSNAVSQKVSEVKTNFQNGIRDMVDNAVNTMRNLASQIQGALGNLSNLLFQQGQQILVGLINGIQSKIGDVQSKLSELTGLIPDWKGPMDVDQKLLTPNGEAIVDGLIAGFQKAVPRVRAELQGLTLALPGFAAPSALFAPSSGSMAAPAVYVTIGNEAVDQFVTTRVEQANRRDMRTAAQGVRI